MDNPITINSALINQWSIERLSMQEVEEKLIALGYDSDYINVHLKEFNKLKYAKRQNAGFVLVGIGALLGFLSCVLTMVNPIPDLNDFFLYGLTSIAIIVVMMGLYLVFE